MSEEADRARRLGAERQAHGDDWYERHLETFRPSVVSDDADPADVSLYHAAIVARMAETVQSGLRGAVLDQGRNIDARGPAEPKPEAGEKVLGAVREFVLRPDADGRNVAFYEALVAADAFRKQFFGRTFERLVKETEAARQRGLFGPPPQA